MFKKIITVVILVWATLTYAQANTMQELVDTVRKEHKVRTLRFVAPEWENQTHKDGTGLYWEVIKAVYEPLGFKVRANNVSWSLAMQLVEESDRFTAIVGEYNDSERNLLFPKNAIDVEYLYVAYLKSNNIDWVGKENLTNKRVSWLKDYELLTADSIDFTLVEYKQAKRGIEKLKSGEVDFFMDEENVLIENILANEYSLDDFEIKMIPLGTDLFVGFASRPDTKLLRDIFDLRIPVLWKNGALTEIYRKWGFDIPSTTVARLGGAVDASLIADK
jgi:hypothetical protein